jgi:alcohol dehydrogenase
MQAAVFDGKDLLLKDVPTPSVGKKEALIKVKAVGICGTDLAIYKGHLPSPTPLILGHEIVGEIVQVGAEVSPKWKGKRVTCEINANNCNLCFFCKHDMPTQCLTRKALGIDINGGFAEFLVVESYMLHDIPAQITDHQATFIEPLAAAYQTFEMMPLTALDRNIVIFGLGKLGLLILQVARTKRLSVTVVDGSNAKLEIAKKLGAKTVINRHTQKDIPAYIRRLTNNLGADIVVDTTGSPDALKDVVASCRTRGKIHMKSTHGLATPLNITDIVVREITIYSSRCGPFEKAIEGMMSGMIKVDDLVSLVVPLEKIKEGFASYENNPDHIKTIVEIPKKE